MSSPRALSLKPLVAAIPAMHPWPLWLWGMIGFFGLIDLLWVAATPLSLAPDTALRLAGLAVLLLLGPWATLRLAPCPRLQSLTTGGLLLMTAWPVLRLTNHLTMTTALPLADAWLARGDAALGFDWLAYVQAIDGAPTLLHAMRFTYQGLSGYSVLLYALLLLTPRPAARCAEFVALFLLTAFACIIIGMAFPALSAIVFYDPPPDAFVHPVTRTGAYHLSALMELRSNPAARLDLTTMPGLVTFPSFHTAMGVLAIYCTRGVWWLFLPSVLVNTTMIAGTPIFGAHYGVDILAGAGVAMALILTLRVLRAVPRARRIQIA